MLKAIMGRSTLVAAICAIALTAHAMADAPRRIDVPAGELVAALETLSRQAAVDLVFRPDQLKSFRTEGVSGTYSPQDAIRILLKGTPLQLHTDAASGAMVIAPPATSRTSRLSPRGKGPNSEGSTFTAGDRKSFWNRLRLAQSETSSDSPEERWGGEGDIAAPSPNAAVLEEIVVTGTRIRGLKDSPSPSVTLDRRDIDASGATSLQELLRTVPQNFSGGVSDLGAAAFDGRANELNSVLGAGVNLRGLGTESTLVLLDGRRLPQGGIGNFVDIAAIPLSIIERVEVVPDGASAIYGSDAVGGVVNFILREEFAGAETGLRYRRVTDGGHYEFAANQLLGTTWDSGGVFLNIDYGKTEPLLASERDFAASDPINAGNTLSPRDERWGVLAKGRQSLGDRLKLSALAYANSRDAAGQVFDPFALQVLSFGGPTEQIGGTVAVEWDVSGWIVDLAQTLAGSDTHRTTIFGDPANPPTKINAFHDIRTTQIGAEGPVFALPGGPVRLAVGGERRSEQLDVERVNFGFAEFQPLRRRVSALYAESFIPLVSEVNALAGVRRLEATAALRYEEYDDVGDSTTYKFGLVWFPAASLRLRATRGTSFRAPFLFQFDSSFGQAFAYDAINPESPTGATTVVLTGTGPHPNLGPENATTWTAGFDVEPEAFFGIRLSGTYFDIDYEDRIAVPRSTASIFTPFSDPVYGELISMPPDPEILSWIATLPPTAISNFSSAPTVFDVDGALDLRIRNLASTKVSGLDIAADWSHETDRGTFSAGVSATRLFRFRNRVSSGAPIVEVADTLYNPIDLRLRSWFGWAHAGFSATAFVSYADDYDNTSLPDNPEIPSWTTVDLALSYAIERGERVTSGLTLHFNATNVFDEPPPRVQIPGTVNASIFDPGYDTQNANPFGRMMGFQIVKAW